MSEFPTLPDRVQRLHALRWKALLKERGFTSEHLQWHASRDRRREAAKPLFSLKPPPPDVLPGPPRRSMKYYGSKGELISYDQWKRGQMEAWAVRENDPKIIDNIAITETIALAQARFAGVVGDYLLVWAEANTDCDEFEHWLEQLATVVAREVGDAWRENEWHTQWFERACQQKVEVALAELVKEWAGRASKLEIQALENPQLSRRSLLDSQGDVAVASQREREKKAVLDVDRAPQSDPGKAIASVVESPGQTRSRGGVSPGRQVRTELAGPRSHEAAPRNLARAEFVREGDPEAEPLQWEDIRISFLSEDRVRILVGARTVQHNYAELGFEDMRSRKPNQGWQLLRQLAVHRGILPNISRNSKQFLAIEKSIHRLRKSLQELFGIFSDPLPYDPPRGYCCCFKIECGRSFDS
ncbi:MAG: hypothetical protein ABSG56_18445 [Bryobacteraceae bacterium]